LKPGDRERAGAATLEITQPRGPCNQLDIYGPAIKGEIFDRRVKDGDSSSPFWGMSGWYTAVREPGLARAGDAIEVVE
jgi:MOSC domain-containing protein YiiM